MATVVTNYSAVPASVTGLNTGTYMGSSSSHTSALDMLKWTLAAGNYCSINGTVTAVNANNQAISTHHFSVQCKDNTLANSWATYETVQDVESYEVTKMSLRLDGSSNFILQIAHGDWGSHKLYVHFTYSGVFSTVPYGVYDGTATATGSATDITSLRTPFIRTLMDDTTAALARATLVAAPAGAYRSMWVDASAMFSRTTTGAASATVEASTNKQMSDSFDFDTASDEFVCFRTAMPDEWNRGTVKAKFFWTAASGSGTVNWAIQAVALSNDDAIDTAYGTAVGVEDTLITAGDVHVSAATAAVTVGGTPALGDVVYWQVYRDVSEDTLDADARLLGVQIQYREGTSEAAAW